MFTLAVATVVDVPEFRALGPWIPLAELITEAEHSLLGAGLFLVAARAAEHGVEAMLVDAAQQGRGLQAVTRGAWSGLLDDGTRVDVVLHTADFQPQVVAADRLVAESDDLVEVVPGVDVHDGEGQWRWPECLGRDVEHDHGILAAGEKQHGPFEGRCNFAEDVDGLGFQGAQVR